MLFDEIRKYAENSGIAQAIASAPAVLCAYSGGADSSVLLNFLRYYLKDYLQNSGIKLYAAHMTHMIRGDAADSDEMFCRRICAEMGVELFVSRRDVPAEAKLSGEGLEEAARHLRYEFLQSAAEKVGGALIATAHNATDNAETVIFNLARGASVKGLGGISPVRDAKIIRPLLSVTSEEIREYARKSGIEYVVDKTNYDTDYTRNFIRHNIIPALRQINPKADAAIMRMARCAREDEAYITDIAKSFIGDNTFLKTDSFNELPLPVRKRAVMLLCERKTGCRNITEKNIADVINLASSGKVGQISLPGAEFFVHRDAIFIKQHGTEIAKIPEKVALKLGEGVNFGNYNIYLIKNNDKIAEIEGNIYRLFIDIELFCDIIYTNIFVRTRREGDSYFLNGVNHRLKKLMCDKKIPLRQRAALPLICNENEIMLVPGLPPTDKCRPKKEGGGNLRVVIFQKNEI